MNYFKWVAILTLSGFMSATAQPLYPLNAEQNKIFQALTHQYRCMVCANESLAESGSTFATDLKQLIFQKIKQGKSKHAINQQLMNRFGTQISLNPPKRANTFFLWSFPFLFLFIGALIYQRKRRVI
jgi:cytochrome c-type biogenesis protein CcmH